MAIPPIPRLVLVLQRTTGDSSLAAWGLPNDRAVDVTPGVPGIIDALSWAELYQPQEGPVFAMAVDSVFGRVGAVVAQLGDYVASLVSNDSSVAGANVKEALETLEAAQAALAAALAALDTTSMVLFGADNVQASTTTRYLPAGYTSTAAPTNLLQYRVPGAGTLRRLRVHHGSPAGAGLPIVYTLRVNGVASALAVSLLSTASDGSDLVNSAAVAAGDLIDIAVTKALGIGSSPMEITASLEWLPS